MELPLIPRKFLADFVRGYFDGDGTIAFEGVSNGPYNRLKVIFTSGSKKFLVSLAESIKREGISKEGDVYDSHRSYQLIYRSRNALSVLKFIYSRLEKGKGLFLERKYHIYRKLISEPHALGCANLFDRQSKIWHYDTNRRRTQVA